MDENLARLELSPIDRQQALKKRVELLSLKLRDKPAERGRPPGAKEVAEQTGRAESTTQRDVHRATMIPEDVQEKIAEREGVTKETASEVVSQISANLQKSDKVFADFADADFKPPQGAKRPQGH